VRQQPVFESYSNPSAIRLRLTLAKLAGETKTRRVGLNDIIGDYTFRPSETKTKRHNEMRTQKPETEK